MTMLNSIKQPENKLQLIDGLTCNLEFVTPQKAAQYLEANQGNRNIRNSRVDRLADQMKAGFWRFTGDVIKFDNFGRLIDGQHRMSAVIKSNTAQYFLIVNGLTAETQFAIDRGIARTLGDDLHFQFNAKNASQLAAIVRLDWARRNIGGNFINNRMLTLSAEELSNHYLDRREIFDKAATFTTSERLRKILSPSVVGMFWIAFNDIDKEWANWFWSVLAGDAQAKETDPVFLLRKRLLDAALSKRKLNQAMQVALVTKAWNMSREGREIKALMYRPTGPTPEPFPVLSSNEV